MKHLKKPITLSLLIYLFDQLLGLEATQQSSENTTDLQKSLPLNEVKKTNLEVRYLSFSSQIF